MRRVVVRSVVTRRVVERCSVVERSRRVVSVQAAQLMQQGAAAVAVAAIEDARQAPTGERMELELAERRFDLKRKIEDWDQSLKERQKPWARDV